MVRLSKELEDVLVDVREVVVSSLEYHEAQDKMKSAECGREVTSYMTARLQVTRDKLDALLGVTNVTRLQRLVEAAGG